jgi:NAD dependent epimerase/dehydratase family enzyme
MGWIHEEDLHRLFERGLTDDSMQGAYIASAPNPVSQAEFMRELRRAVAMPFGLPASEWMVRLGCRWMLRTDPELALYGRRVVSRRLAEEGFEFRYGELRPALESLFAPRGSAVERHKLATG